MRVNGTLQIVDEEVQSGDVDVALQLTVESPQETTYKLMQYVPAAFTIDKAVYQTTSGSITANIRINTTSVGGLSALSVTGTEAETAASSNNLVAVGDTLDIVLTSNSSAVMVSITIVGRIIT